MDKQTKRILDPCCGSKMFWFDKNNPDVVFCDIRIVEKKEIWRSKDGTKTRSLEILPDTVCDVRNLPFDDNTFYHVVFDPPHLQRVGKTSWLVEKYGKLPVDWKPFIHDGFAECMRVLKPNGILVFKWSEVDIALKDILSVLPAKPLYGNRSGKHMTTHWLVFMKDSNEG